MNKKLIYFLVTAVGCLVGFFLISNKSTQYSLYSCSLDDDGEDYFEDPDLDFDEVV